MDDVRRVFNFGYKNSHFNELYFNFNLPWGFHEENSICDVISELLPSIFNSPKNRAKIFSPEIV